MSLRPNPLSPLPLLFAGASALALTSAAAARPTTTHHGGLTHNRPAHRTARPAQVPARTRHVAPSSVFSKGEENIRIAASGAGESVLNPSTHVHGTTQVTVFSAAQLTATGQTTVMAALAQASAAITSPPQPGVGNNALVQTMQLRGQSADDTLILVNGHRRHIGANFNANAGPNWGTEPTDIALIPVSAIDHVEVITEGASALYGQDAIAGAVNIVLKNADHGGSVTLQNSGFYAGDGQALNGYAHYGTGIGQTGGTLNLAAQIVHQLPTNRTGLLTVAPYPAGDPRNATASRDVQRILGIPKSTLETASANILMPLFDRTNLYSTSTFSHRDAHVAETYRSAANSLTDDTLWPNGAIPYVFLDQYDFETDNGIKAHQFGFSWDAYVNFARDDQTTRTMHSDNRSLGADDKRDFYDGKTIVSELSAGLRGSRQFGASFLPRPVSLVFGSEYRHDTFQMTEGEEASWIGLAAMDHGGNTPAAVTDRNRDVYDGNVSLKGYLTKDWEWTLGGRAVNYARLATVETGSVGTRYNFSRNWAIRGSVNTGYRPPTLGQLYYFYNAPFATYAVDQLPVSSPAARALGAGGTKGESSRSYSIGLDATPLPNWSLTANLYAIAINNRLASTTTFGGPGVATILQDAGLHNVTFASYYTNPVNTRTYGGDINTSYTLRTRTAGVFRFAFAFNYSDNEIRSYNRTPAVLANLGLKTFNTYAEQVLLHSAPKNREILTVNWSRGKLELMAQEQRFGSTLFLASPTSPSVTINPAFLTNLSATYHFTPRWTGTIGANNAFDKYPTRIPASVAASSLGAYKYSFYSPFGFNGGMYYVQLGLTF